MARPRKPSVAIVSGPFGFWSSAGIAALLAGLGAAMGDARYLVLLSGPFFAFAVWTAGSERLRGIKKWLFLVTLWLAIGCFLGVIYKRLAQDVIVLNTSRLEFYAGMPRQSFPVVARNISKQEAYAVQAKMKMGAGHPYNEFNFSVSRDSLRPSVDGSALSDIIAGRCWDANGRDIVLYWIYHIEPQGMREIDITHAIESSASVDVTVSHFLLSAPPRINSPSMATQKFVADEKMSCNSFTMQSPKSTAP